MREETRQQPKPKQFNDPKLFQRAIKAVRDCMAKYGPVYVRAVVPNWGKRAFDRGQYSAWYVGHFDPSYLDDEQIESYVSECFDSEEAKKLPEAAAVFFAFLERKGYIVFNSGPEGVCTVNIDPDSEG